MNGPTGPVAITVSGLWLALEILLQSSSRAFGATPSRIVNQSNACLGDLCYAYIMTSWTI